MSYKGFLGGVRVSRPSAANLRDPPPRGVFDSFPKQKMLTLKKTSLSYFGNISVKILLDHIKMDIFRIYMERAFEKFPR